MTVSFPASPHRYVAVPYRLTPLLHLARRRAIETIDHHLEPLSLSTDECCILNILADADGPCSMKGIEGILHYSPDIMSACYTDLADRLLIDVTGETVRITAVGMAFLYAAFDLYDGAYKDLSGDMTPEDLAAGMEFLRKLAALPASSRRTPVPITELRATVAG